MSEERAHQQKRCGRLDGRRQEPALDVVVRYEPDDARVIATLVRWLTYRSAQERDRPHNELDGPAPDAHP